MQQFDDEDRLGLIRAFVSVTELSSFVRGARAVGLTPSTASRKIGRLEAVLGVRLLHRTTRRVSLTEAGGIYYERCMRLLSDLTEADAAVADLNSDPRGSLCINLPAAFGRLHISPVIPEFLAQYPNLRIEATFTDRYVDLVEAGVDVAVRIGDLRDSRLRVRRLAANRRLLVASPLYLARHGAPTKPADLAAHNCLGFSHLSSGDIWKFERSGRVRSVAVSGRLKASNAEALHDAALGGLGIAILGTFICSESVRVGRLVPLLADWTCAPKTNIYAAYASSQYLAPKTRVFIDFLADRFHGTPWWDRDLSGADELRSES
jgi:DNA-binding transcriptional LysR family regulator